MLFNLAADALDHILNKAKTKGHIGGLAADLLEEGGGLLIFNMMTIQSS